MKKFLKVIFLLILVLLSISLLFIGNGYNMYKEALNDTPIQEKVADIKSKQNYTEF